MPQHYHDRRTRDDMWGIVVHKEVGAYMRNLEEYTPIDVLRQKRIALIAIGYNEKPHDSDESGRRTHLLRDGEGSFNDGTHNSRKDQLTTVLTTVVWLQLAEVLVEGLLK